MVLLLSVVCVAQRTELEAPSAPIQPVFLLSHAEVLPAPALAILVSTPQKEQIVITKSFIAWTIADGATVAADALTTVHCLSQPNCVEKNPFFGSHPSTQRVVATESAFFAADTLVSYWLKKKGKSWWWVPGMVNTAQGGIAAGLNLRHW